MPNEAATTGSYLFLLCLTFGVGLVTGLLFSVMNLPIPAPTELPSIIGILGIFSGLVLVRAWKSEQQT